MAYSNISAKPLSKSYSIAINAIVHLFIFFWYMCVVAVIINLMYKDVVIPVHV